MSAAGIAARLEDIRTLAPATTSDEYDTSFLVRSQYLARGIELSRVITYMNRTWPSGSYDYSVDRDWVIVTLNTDHPEVQYSAAEADMSKVCA